MTPCSRTRGRSPKGIQRHLGSVGGPFADADPTEAVTLWHALEEQHYHSYLAGELDFQGQRRATARDFAAAHGVELTEGDAAAWFDTYFQRYRESWRLHDDALPCLDVLGAAFPGIRFGRAGLREAGPELRACLRGLRGGAGGCRLRVRRITTLAELPAALTAHP